MLTRKQFCLLSLGTALAGCGGGKDFDPQAPITPRIRVKWPTIGRALEASPDAMSVRVALSDASLTTESQEVVILANRSGELAYEAEYAATESILPGRVRMQVEFFADPNGQGRQLLQSVEEVEPDREGFLPPVSLQSGAGVVTGLRLFDPLGISGPRYVFATVLLRVETTPTDLFDSQGLNADDLTWEIESSNPELGAVVEIAPPVSFVLKNNLFGARALRPGTATVMATIDGVKSNAMTITIVEP